MSQSLSSKRLTAIASESRTDIECARIVRTDGQTFGITDHVADITIGAVTYVTANGYTPTAHSSASNYTANTVDVDGILSLTGVDRSEIEDGLFDYADIFVFQTDYTDPVADEHPLFAGKWGRCQLMEGRYKTEFHSLKELLSQPIGRTHQASCDATLGDSACGVRLDVSAWAASTAYTVREAADAATGDIVKPTTEDGRFYKCTTAGTSDTTEPTWDTTIGNTTTDGTVVWTAIQATTLTGTVTTVTDNRVFQDSSRDEQDGWWDFGKITWTSGDNAGLSMEIKNFTYVNGSPGDPQISLFLPMTNDVQVGDQYTIEAGCRKRWSEDCQTKYDNSDNFQGFPHIPTTDQVRKFGGQ